MKAACTPQPLPPCALCFNVSVTTLFIIYYAITKETQCRENRQPDHHDHHSIHQYILHAKLHEPERTGKHFNPVQI